MFKGVDKIKSRIWQLKIEENTYFWKGRNWSSCELFWDYSRVAGWFLFFNWFENGLIEGGRRGGQIECSKGKELIKWRVGYDN